MGRRMGDLGSVHRASSQAETLCPQIINHQSSTINPKGFTLIELLVVISIIVLLVAILLPSLQRVRKQARAVVCRAQLHQWGILYETYAAENNGYLPDWGPSWRGTGPTDPWWAITRWMWGSIDPAAKGTPESASWTGVKDILCCPMAARPGYPNLGPGNLKGGTFLAWSMSDPQETPWWYWYSSYATNDQAHSYRKDNPSLSDAWIWWCMWMTTGVKNAAAVPVFLDSMAPVVTWRDGKFPPPEYDAIPTRLIKSGRDSACINRHDGGINSLFLDWSVRKVGLKELWTLKWHTQYNTRGPWTKAGGAKPEDWPQWMRNFRDY